MEKEESLSGIKTDNSIADNSLLRSAHSSSSGTQSDSAEKYSADNSAGTVTDDTPAERNVLPVFTLDVSKTAATVIISIWVSVSIILLAIVLVNRIRTNVLLKQAYINKKKEWKKALSALKRKGYDCRNARLYSVPFWNGSPFSFGCIRSSIIVPEASVSWNSEQKQAVLLHEMQHIQGCDLLTGLALDIMNALFWPCALGKFLERQLEQAQEERCDMYAVRSVRNPLEYADLLLNFAYSPNSYVLPGAQGYAGKSSITRRINMIENYIAGFIIPSMRFFSYDSIKKALLTATLPRGLPVRQAGRRREFISLFTSFIYSTVYLSFLSSFFCSTAAFFYISKKTSKITIYQFLR